MKSYKNFIHNTGKNMRPSELCTIDKIISESYGRETHVSPTTVSEKETEKLKIRKPKALEILSVLFR